MATALVQNCGANMAATEELQTVSLPSVYAGKGAFTVR